MKKQQIDYYNHEFTTRIDVLTVSPLKDVFIFKNKYGHNKSGLTTTSELFVNGVYIATAGGRYSEEYDFQKSMIETIRVYEKNKKNLDPRDQPDEKSKIKVLNFLESGCKGGRDRYDQFLSIAEI